MGGFALAPGVHYLRQSEGDGNELKVECHSGRARAKTGCQTRAQLPADDFHRRRFPHVAHRICAILFLDSSGEDAGAAARSVGGGKVENGESLVRADFRQRLTSSPRTSRRSKSAHQLHQHVIGTQTVALVIKVSHVEV